MPQIKWPTDVEHVMLGAMLRDLPRDVVRAVFDPEDKDFAFYEFVWTREWSEALRDAVESGEICGGAPHSGRLQGRMTDLVSARSIRAFLIKRGLDVVPAQPAKQRAETTRAHPCE